MAVQIITVSPADNGMRLDKWFKVHYNTSFIQVQKKCRKGEIRIDGKRVKSNATIHTGMQIRIPPLPPKKAPNPKAYNAQDADFIRSLIIYKDDNIIALNKPAGIAVQGGSHMTIHIDGLCRYLHRDTQQKPRLIHRLDKDTSGVLLLARNKQMATQLGRAFKADKPRKIYWAIVVGEPQIPTGTIKAPILKKRRGSAEKMTVDPDGKHAVTEYEVLHRMGGVLSLLALYPRTGRTHQLRVHMALLNTPILGDGKYGGKNAFVSDEPHMKKMHLHARSITTNGVSVIADIPPHFKQSFKMFEVDILPYYDTVFGGGTPCD